MPPQVFISYSHKDKKFCDELYDQLLPLERAGRAKIWRDDRKIRAGSQWRDEINAQLDQSQIVLLLVSSNFFGSDYCNQVEVPRALERHAAGQARVIPVILSPVYWQELFGEFHALPRGAKPVILWKFRGEAYENITRGVREALPVDPEAGPRPSPESSPASGPASGQDGYSQAHDSYFYNLPQPPTRFVGRKKERQQIKKLISKEVSLLVLLGSPGSGKTRLAQKVAEDLALEFESGACFVPLDRIDEPALVPSAIAEALRIQQPERTDIKENLKNYFSGKRMLLLLDNFEHLISDGKDSAVEFIVDLLAGNPLLKVLITSREDVAIQGQREPLPDLLPSDAVELFLQSARAVNRRAVQEMDRAQVAEICARLQYIPLAIDLAAAQSDVFLPPEMLPRLKRQLPFLKRRWAGIPKRHQTMWAAIEWSYNLLDSPEVQAFLTRLSVFSGGWVPESAAEVCNAENFLKIDVEPVLVSLVRKNLLRRETGTSELRFTMLDVVREFGAKLLERSHDGDELQRLRGLHARHFTELAEAAERRITSDRRKGELQRLEAEHANFREALGWCQKNDRELGLRLAGALFWFWNLRSHFSEGSAWFEGLLAQTPPAGCPWAHAKALYGAGGLAFLQGDYETASRRLAESVKMWLGLEDERGLAYALVLQGAVASHQGDFDPALKSEQKSVEIFRRLGDRWGHALALNDLGNVYRLKGEYKEARKFFYDSLHLWRSMGDEWGLPLTLSNLGFLEMFDRDFHGARKTLKEALEIQRQAKDVWGLAETLKVLADLAVRLERYEEAETLYRESLALNRQIGRKPFAIGCLAGLATVAAEVGPPEYAERLFEAVESLRGSSSVPVKAFDSEKYDLALEKHRSRSPVAGELDAASRAGLDVDWTKIIQFALQARAVAPASRPAELRAGATGRTGTSRRKAEVVDLR
ncbi:MAG TPA: tetratricopeptide repeat protein [Thermoanaerobaculia bacterium]|jgi:predicted ATPase|nr:tetratricopeptide repeat protein [Thermoanaerobaculia bacterium]